MMRGPWDRQNHHKAFAVNLERPEGAGFYPENVTQETWEQFIEDHPEEKSQLESLVTMVVGIILRISHISSTICWFR